MRSFKKGFKRLGIFASFTTGQGWIQLITLIFLEMVLGIDNLVFIVITTDRLPQNKQHIGRRFGLIAALCMRCLLLCLLSFLASLTTTLFTIPFISGSPGEITARDIIMLAGGIYLVYKGIFELVAKINLKDEDDMAIYHKGGRKTIGLVHAVALIAVMDVVFSLDSVITAVGLVNELAVMISAVIIAVLVMIIFADPIANFINKYSGIKILALTFIVFIGIVLCAEGFNLELNKTAVYFSMAFALITQLIEIKGGKKGALIAIVILCVISFILMSVIPGIVWYMPICGVVTSLLIICFQIIYENNCKKAQEVAKE